MEHILRGIVAIFFAITLAGSTSVFADNRIINLCKEFSATAELIMQARQKTQLSMFEVLELVVPGPDQTGMAEDLKRLVLAAYEEPIRMTENNKNKEIKRFGNQVAVECVRAGSAAN